MVFMRTSEVKKKRFRPLSPWAQCLYFLGEFRPVNNTFLNTRRDVFDDQFMDPLLLMVSAKGPIKKYTPFYPFNTILLRGAVKKNLHLAPHPAIGLKGHMSKNVRYFVCIEILVFLNENFSSEHFLPSTKKLTCHEFNFFYSKLPCD